MRTTISLPVERLREIGCVSGIIPLPNSFSLAAVAQDFSAWSGHAMGVAVVEDPTDPHFPNSRGNIEYLFDTEPYRIVLGAPISEESALRVLFFVAHGLGHALQTADQIKAAVSDLIIHPASSFPGSRRMREPVTLEGIAKPFEDWFTPHEREASQTGWSLLEEWMSNEGYGSTQIEEVRFWYALYGIVDHAYHRQSIIGPFPFDPNGWLKIFGEKMEAVLMPFLLDNYNRSQSDPTCAYIGSDGWFHLSESTPTGAALGRMELFFREGKIDPFPRLSDSIQTSRHG